MPRKIKYCANHSDIAATDSCHECEKDICYNCRREYSKKVYCSIRCFRKHVYRKIDDRVPSAIKVPLKIILWPLLQLLQLYRWHVLKWVLIAAVAFTLYQLQSLHQKLDSMKFTGLPALSADGLVDTTLIPKPKVFKPVKGGRILESTIDVKGESEPNWIIALTINDEIYDIDLPKTGEFLFKNVPLSRDKNHLEVRAMNAKGEVFVLQSLDFTYSYPNLEYLAKSVKRGPVNKEMVALTFDGGAEDNIANEILDYLKEKDVKCTFFLTGTFIRQYQQTVLRIVEEGHEVGNHSWKHPHLTSYADNRKQVTLENINRTLLHEELEKTAGLFKLITQQDMVGLWRAPYGEYNREILSWAADVGYKHIAWTVGRGWEENMDTLDWVADKNSKIYHTADEIARKLLGYKKKNRHGAKGAIVLMHLGSNRTEDFPHQKLPTIIDGLQKQGYALVRISEMLDM